MDSMGKRVKALREALGMSQAALARAVGISQPSLWAIERDQIRTTLKASTMQGLCEVLSTTSKYLLEGSTTSPSSHQNGETEELSKMEAELTAILRALTPEQRLALMSYARYLKDPVEKPKRRSTDSQRPKLVANRKRT